KPRLKASRVVSSPSPATRPPLSAPTISATTTCTRHKLSTNIRATANTIAFMAFPYRFTNNGELCGKRALLAKIPSRVPNWALTKRACPLRLMAPTHHTPPLEEVTSHGFIHVERCHWQWQAAA